MNRTQVVQALSQHELVYMVTSLPTIIFCEKVKASEPISFDKDYKPLDYSPEILDCRFILFDPQGQMVAMEARVAEVRTLTSLLNTVPMQMIKELVKSLLTDEFVPVVTD